MQNNKSSITYCFSESLTHELEECITVMRMEGEEEYLNPLFAGRKPSYNFVKLIFREIMGIYRLGESGTKKSLNYLTVVMTDGVMFHIFYPVSVGHFFW